MKWLALWVALSGAGMEADGVPPVAEVATKAGDVTEARITDERSVTAIRNDFRDSMRNEAKTRGTKAHKSAIGRLIRLHREMVAHSTFENGFALKESRTLLQSRLVRIERDLRKAHDYPRKPARVAAKPPLAQFMPGGNQGNANQGGANQQGGGLGANGQLPDIGPELADLIQTVIDPKFWDVNGGPGSIVYFQPLRALVVTATAEVHANLAGVFNQMRKVQ